MTNVLVTGSNSGFGSLAALEFARRGEKVFASMRTPGKATALLDAARRDGLTLEVVELDVTSDSSVAVALGSIPDVDVLVNNAGFGMHAALEDVDDDEAKAVLEVNVFGALRMMRAVAPQMRARGSGTIVNVSSIAGRVTSPFGGIYSASKYALEALSEAMYYELGFFGIRVAIVEPGFFPTGFDDRRTAVRRAGASGYHDLMARWDQALTKLPGRDGPPQDPNDVARTIVEAATTDLPKLRWLVGADAELIWELRRSSDDASFERTMREALDFW